MEEYKICFENYEISNFGNLRRLLKNGSYRQIKGSITNKGYRYFQLNRDGKRQNICFHVMVAEQFIGKRPESYVIDHIDRNPLNNNVNNLRYITHTENMRNTDKYRDDIEEKDPILRKRLMTKDYNLRNKEKVLENKKKYYYNNKETILKKQKIYNNKNKEKRKKYNEEYRKRPIYKEVLKRKNQRAAETIICECGSIMRRDTISKHKKTKSHINYINGNWVFNILW